jgi:hypothetical protein
MQSQAMPTLALRLVVERLVDELGEAERLVWANTTSSDDPLQAHMEAAMDLACCALDGLPP